MKPLKQTQLSSNSFYPIPKIDLSLIKLHPKEEIDPFLKENKSKRFYLDFIAGIMPYKNKNLANAIELYFKNNPAINLNKEDILRILEHMNYENNKLINFKIENFIDIAKNLYNLCENN